MAQALGPEERLNFLRSCLVEGDPDQERRVHRSKRRALFVSIAVQILIVAALVLLPLLSKGENIASRVIFFPTVPYNHSGSSNHRTNTPHPPHGNPPACRFCPPPSIPDTIVTRDPGTISDPGEPTGPEIPGLPPGLSVPGGLTPPDSRREPPQPPGTRPLSVKRRRISSLVQAAMLIHRVEPVYSPLAIQLHREGRVELHAIISSDGSIQSLEVISGDPFLIQSALAAVREWRYRPTLLNDQPVEVDTHITVVYTLSH